MALAPLPITATRRPSTSTSAGQRAVWNTGPEKESRPGIGGMAGVLKAPTALMRTLASSVSSVPSAVRMSTDQVWRSASQTAERTSVPNRMFGPTANRDATPAR